MTDTELADKIERANILVWRRLPEEERAAIVAALRARSPR